MNRELYDIEILFKLKQGQDRFQLVNTGDLEPWAELYLTGYVFEMCSTHSKSEKTKNWRFHAFLFEILKVSFHPSCTSTTRFWATCGV